MIFIEKDEIPEIFHHVSHVFVSPPFTWMFKIIAHGFQVSTSFMASKIPQRVVCLEKDYTFYICLTSLLINHLINFFTTRCNDLYLKSTNKCTLYDELLTSLENTWTCSRNSMLKTKTYFHFSQLCMHLPFKVLWQR